MLRLRTTSGLRREKHFVFIGNTKADGVFWLLRFLTMGSYLSLVHHLLGPFVNICACLGHAFKMHLGCGAVYPGRIWIPGDAWRPRSCVLNRPVIVRGPQAQPRNNLIFIRNLHTCSPEQVGLSLESMTLLLKQSGLWSRLEFHFSARDSVMVLCT